MLAKVGELNKNVVILLSVAMIAITSIVITLMVTSEGESTSSAGSLKQFKSAFEKEHGVAPDIDIIVDHVSEAQAETIAKSVAEDLNLEDVRSKEDDDGGWYATSDEYRTLTFMAIYE